MSPVMVALSTMQRHPRSGYVWIAEKSDEAPTPKLAECSLEGAEARIPFQILRDSVAPAKVGEVEPNRQSRVRQS